MPIKDPVRKAAYNKEYRAKNLDRLRAQEKAKVRTPEQKARFNEYCKKRYREKKDHILAVGKIWVEKNRDKTRAATKRWCERHPDRAKESKLRTREKRREINKQQAQAYREKHPENVAKYEANRQAKIKSSPEAHERRKEGQRRYYERNREKRIEAVKQYISENQESYRLWSRVSAARRKSKAVKAGGNFTKKQWLWRMEFYGYRCAYCLTPVTEKNVHIDHVIPISKGGTNWPSNLVPACKKCNLRKGVKRWLPSWLKKEAA